MRIVSKLPLMVAGVVLSACYHATIETGRPAGDRVIHRPWVNSFIGGLVPPPVVQTAAECPNGVSRVETQHTILNQLVGFITFGIYTPMTITVTCASGGAAALPTGRTIEVGSNASTAERQAALGKAAEMSAATGAPVFVQFRSF